MGIFNTFFYEPLYNLLVLFLGVIPLHDVGAAIILVTCVVKGILLPLNISATRSQYALKKVEKEIQDIREKHKNNPQEAGTKMMEIYKREKINPLSSLFAVLLQIPVFIALYLVFSKGIHAQTEMLYSFVTFPETLHTNAFGILDVTQKNFIVALLTGITAYLLARRQTATMTTSTGSKTPSFQESFQHSLKIQMLYVFPVLILSTAMFFPAAVGVYWITSNILGIFQDIYIKKKYVTNVQ